MPDQTTLTLDVSGGRIVELRTLDLAELMMNGEIPDHLTGLVEYLIAQTLAAKGFASLEERDAVEAMLNPKKKDQEEAYQRWVNLVRIVVRLATVNPIICSDIKEARDLRAAGKSTAYISQYTRDDLFGIYFRSQGVAADAIPFLLKSLFEEPVMATVPDSAGVAPGTEQLAGDPAEPDVGGIHGGLGSDPLGAVRREQPVRTQRQRRSKVDHPATTGQPK